MHGDQSKPVKKTSKIDCVCFKDLLNFVFIYLSHVFIERKFD